MCEFCVTHGDGRAWYLEAANYAFDLTRDLERYDYIVGFVRGFDERSARSIEWMERLAAAPEPLRSAGREIASRRMRSRHFGQPVPIEECEEIVRMCTSIVQVPCICRKFAGTKDDGCCLLVTTGPTGDLLDDAFRDFQHGPDTAPFQELDADGAMALMRRAETRGQMHSVWTFLTPFIAAICNCDLRSGCMAMRTTVEFDVKLMWKGERAAVLDTETCDGCGACVESCPFGALALDELSRRPHVEGEDCYGCGVCRAACTAESIRLEPRSAVVGVPVAW